MTFLIPLIPIYLIGLYISSWYFIEYSTDSGKVVAVKIILWPILVTIFFIKTAAIIIWRAILK